MGHDVGGLRDSFYRDLRREYREEGVNSFLYRYFWTEAVTELLEKYAPRFPVERPIQPEHSGQIRARLGKTVREHPELLLRTVPEKRRRNADGEEPRGRRRDFWAELWLNDAGYQAQLISDTDYYLWLVKYLAAHDLYYKDTTMWDGRPWLDKLLREGWLGAGEERSPGVWRQKSGKSVPSTARTSADLRELAERLKTDGGEIARRLHGLETQGEDYLPWLTGRLEQMALHTKIKDWLQNSGYPILKEGDMSAGCSAKRGRKQDFSMRLLEAYQASGRGGSFLRLDQDGGGGIRGWRLTEDGFCLPDGEEVEALRETLERSGRTCVYIPLAVDLQSGCVLFLAGKDTYEQVYQEEAQKWSKYRDRMEKELRQAQGAYEQAKAQFSDSKTLKELRDKKRAACEAAKRGCTRAEEARERYKTSPARLCFDYLRLDRAHLSRFGENPAGAFRLRPVFHRQAEEGGYQAVLTKFLAYCKGECDRTARGATPREAVREFDQEPPAGIPQAFRWAFEAWSQESEDAFNQSYRRPLEAPGQACP